MHQLPKSKAAVRPGLYYLLLEIRSAPSGADVAVWRRGESSGTPRRLTGCFRPRKTC